MTWVASVTTCLKALGVECDLADVAGYSGYAFCMSVHKELCPSGPTVIDWHRLADGVNCLGRAAVSFFSYSEYPLNKEGELYQKNSRALYEFVRRETDAGRPCVIWGTYVPEFAVAIGCADDHYHVSSFRQCINQEQPPIPLADLDLVNIHYALAFPTKSFLHPESADQRVVHHAAQLLTQRGDFVGYGWGAEGYRNWITALEQNKAHVFGNAYNAQCWHEMKHLAGVFLKRIADRYERVSAPLTEAAGHLAICAEHLERVAKLFSFPPQVEELSAADRSTGVASLQYAAAAEEQAVSALLKACEAPWEIKYE
jgi:hypothetical protein